MVKIGAVTLQGGTVNFSDRSVKPNYSANLLEIGGRISGLSSEENKLADVDLKGKLEDYSPLEITGKINPLREDLYVDLKVDFKDMDLSPVTPYSGKYIGYTIQKGKLSLSLQYLIVKKKLDSQNSVFIDQLTLGDKVESPDATKLPVKLAIALLKDRKGEIKLDIPVTGNIDDPKFSLGRIILKIIVNLLVKAATSPFALLGAIFGGGEELSYLDFGYGSSAINEQGQKKLDTLIKALYERPALKVDIEGYVDAEKDKEGLRQAMFNRKVKAQKLKDMLKKGLPAVPVDEVKVEQNEYPQYLKMAYKEEKFPKPRNIIGIAKDLPVPEMEKLMLTHIKVTDDDLRQLASERALTVKEFIMKSGRIDQDRIFLVEPKSLQPEKKEKLSDSRVDFKLK
jgi:acylphosphatase